MDPSQQKFLKLRSDAADESSQAGYMLTGAVVLIVGGIILIMQSHASVADFGGGMLMLIGLALGAASLFLYAQSPR